MAVTVSQLALALRVIAAANETVDPAEGALLLRLLGSAQAVVGVYASSGTPEPVTDQAVILVAAYLWDQPQASRGTSFASAWINSGAAGITEPWRARRAAVLEGDGASADGGSGTAGIDENAVLALIQDWAEAGNTDPIPTSKLANVPSAAARLPELASGEAWVGNPATPTPIATEAQLDELGAIVSALAGGPGGGISRAAVLALISDWAEAGNKATIPRAKLPGGTSSIYNGTKVFFQPDDPSVFIGDLLVDDLWFRVGGSNNVEVYKWNPASSSFVLFYTFPVASSGGSGGSREIFVPRSGVVASESAATGGLLTFEDLPKVAALPNGYKIAFADDLVELVYDGVQASSFRYDGVRLQVGPFANEQHDENIPYPLTYLDGSPLRRGAIKRLSYVEAVLDKDPGPRRWRVLHIVNPPISFEGNDAAVSVARALETLRDQQKLTYRFLKGAPPVRLVTLPTAAQIVGADPEEFQFDLSLGRENPDTGITTPNPDTAVYQRRSWLNSLTPAGDNTRVLIYLRIHDKDVNYDPNDELFFSETDGAGPLGNPTGEEYPVNILLRRTLVDPDTESPGYDFWAAEIPPAAHGKPLRIYRRRVFPAPNPDLEALEKVVTADRLSLAAVTNDVEGLKNLRRIAVDTPTVYNEWMETQHASNRPLVLVIEADIAGNLSQARGGAAFAWKAHDVVWFDPQDTTGNFLFNIASTGTADPDLSDYRTAAAQDIIDNRATAGILDARRDARTADGKAVAAQLLASEAKSAADTAQTNVETEATTRAAADTALGKRIDGIASLAAELAAPVFSPEYWVKVSDARRIFVHLDPNAITSDVSKLQLLLQGVTLSIMAVANREVYFFDVSEIQARNITLAAGNAGSDTVRARLALLDSSDNELRVWHTVLLVLDSAPGAASAGGGFPSTRTEVFETPTDNQPIATTNYNATESFLANQAYELTQVFFIPTRLLFLTPESGEFILRFNTIWANRGNPVTFKFTMNVGSRAIKYETFGGGQSVTPGKAVINKLT